MHAAMLRRLLVGAAHPAGDAGRELRGVPAARAQPRASASSASTATSCRPRWCWRSRSTSGLRQSGAWLIGQEPAADPAVTTHLMALWLVLGSLGVLACWLMLEAGGYVAGYGALALVAALNVAPMLCLRTGQGVFLGRGDLGSLNRSELISRAVMLARHDRPVGPGPARSAHAAIWVLLAAHTSRPPLYLLWQIRGGIAPGTLFQAAAGRPHAALRRRAVGRHAAADPARADRVLGRELAARRGGAGPLFRLAAAGRDPGRGRDRGRDRDLQLRRARRRTSAPPPWTRSGSPGWSRP